jgi:hypothetical protein
MKATMTPAAPALSRQFRRRAALGAALVGLLIAPAYAGEARGTPQFGTCALCCSVYPSGWRGMCVRRCHAWRLWLPPPYRRVARCECGLNWRGEWSCWD